MRCCRKKKADTESESTTVLPEPLAYNGPRYKPVSLANICKSTKFNKREVQIMYRGFKQECPTGIVNEDTFIRVYGQFFPQGDSNLYAAMVFGALDSSKRGCLTFEEFMQALSNLVHGSNQEKLKWAFNLYDHDRNGVISQLELANTISSVYAMMGDSTEPQVSQCMVEQQIENIIQRIGTNSITYEQFFNICNQDQTHDSSFKEFWTDLRLRD